MSPPGDRREPPVDTKCPPAAQRKQAKRACIYETVRPKLVLSAAQYLLSRELFKEEGITDNVLLKLAPGEGKRPLLLTLDKHVEELAYPCAFGGEKRHIPDDISVSKRAKSDIMR